MTQGGYWPPHGDGGGEQPVTVPAPHAAELRPVHPTGTSPWGEQLQRALQSTRVTWHTRALPALGTASGPQRKNDSSRQPVQRLQHPPRNQLKDSNFLQNELFQESGRETKELRASARAARLCMDAAWALPAPVEGKTCAAPQGAASGTVQG